LPCVATRTRCRLTRIARSPLLMSWNDAQTWRGGIALSLKISSEIFSSGSAALRDLVAGRGLHVERMYVGLAVHQVLDQLADLGIILAAVPLRIFFRLPEAQGPDAVWVGHEHNFIHKTGLRLQGGKHFVVEHVANFFGLPRLRFHFNKSHKHGRDSFISVIKFGKTLAKKQLSETKSTYTCLDREVKHLVNTLTSVPPSRPAFFPEKRSCLPGRRPPTSSCS